MQIYSGSLEQFNEQQPREIETDQEAAKRLREEAAKVSETENPIGHNALVRKAVEAEIRAGAKHRAYAAMNGMQIAPDSLVTAPAPSTSESVSFHPVDEQSRESA